MPAHKHAELMALYAQDAAETGKPWERWECLTSSGWERFGGDFFFSPDVEYRRKPQKKAVDLSVLIESKIDCEFSTSPSFELAIWDTLHSLSNRINQYSSSVHSCLRYCRPRMNHWHSWQGGECPLPDGLWVDIDRRDGLGNRGYSTDYSWRHTGTGNDIIAFKVTGLAEGYCWPWEIDNENN